MSWPNPLDYSLVKRYAGPFILSLFVADFVLVMQGLWKYANELIGKGLPLSVLGEFMIHFALQTLPLALPLAVLLSALLVIGRMAEDHEITASKASGISYLRLIRPLIFMSIFVGFTSFILADTLIPKSFQKVYQLRYDIGQKQPALSLNERTFNQSIEGITIYIGSKDPDGATLHQVIVYDHTKDRKVQYMIVSDKARVTTSSDQEILQIEFFQGKIYSEYSDLYALNTPTEYSVTEFDTMIRSFDLGGLSMQETDEESFKTERHKGVHTLVESRHLVEVQVQAIDSLQENLLEGIAVYDVSDTKRLDTQNSNGDFYARLKELSPEQWLGLKSVVQTRLGQINSNYMRNLPMLDYRKRLYANHWNDIHRKYTMASACFLFFLFGGSLGAILKRGGIGYALIVSIVIFVIYLVISSITENMSEEGVLNPHFAMWLPSIILYPVGFYLAIRALNDRGIFTS
ncbi:MAG: LptF/LptG family permease [Chitinophagales bacterium]